MYEVPAVIDKLVGQRTVSLVISKSVSIRHIVESAERIVVLSSPIAYPGFATHAVRIPLKTFAELVELAKKYEIPVVSYHGHQATLDVVNRLAGTTLVANRGEYVPENGDVAVAIRLRKRLERPEDVKDVKPEDIEVILLQYVKVSEE